jgi:hypothetical protein
MTSVSVYPQPLEVSIQNQRSSFPANAADSLALLWLEKYDDKPIGTPKELAERFKATRDEIASELNRRSN